jgi:hypothetical protein
MVVGILSNKIFSSFGQYPLTKQFTNQKITPIREFNPLVQLTYLPDRVS